jgi:hypothetical protein
MDMFRRRRPSSRYVGLGDSLTAGSDGLYANASSRLLLAA